MELAIAVFVSLLSSALLVAAVALLSRRLLLVRRLSPALYLGAVAAGLKIFTLLVSDQPQSLRDALDWILLLLGAVATLQIAGLYLFDVYLRSHRGVRLPPLIPAVSMGAAYLIAALVSFQVIYSETDLTPLLATSAVTSLVLGLALQPILGNFFSGLVISLEKPFRINDWIKVGETEGLVMDITWRTTHIRTRDNDNFVIPNSVIAGEHITNYHYPHPLHLERILVGAPYGTPPYRVREALLKAAAVEGVLDKPTPEVCLHGFDESSIAYELRVWIEDHAQKTRINSAIRESIWEKFRTRGISIPFPIRTLDWPSRQPPIQIAATPPATESVAVPTGGHLFVAHGVDQGTSVPFQGETLTVGRSRNCSLVLREPLASKEHLKIEARDGAFVLSDLDSHHGTRVNGCSVTQTILRDLDRITIGDTEIVFEHHA